MAYKHGVFKTEIPTSLIPPVRTEAGLPVIVGTAPIHLGNDPEAMSNVNKPQLCYGYDEAVALFGFSREFERYTLCEAIYSQFALFNVSPVVLINVLDPSEHKTVGSVAETFEVSDGKAVLGKDIPLDWVEVQSPSGETGEPAAGKDFSLGFSGDGEAVLNILKGGMFEGKTTVSAKVSRLSPEAVDEYDIIGGVNIATGDYEGLELVNDIFPKFRLIP
ncbi:MAG: phage tail sheath family protein, partial [Synergistales bacterium]|nr:phage tail sheath family protein [Synergistales bacterium]